MPAGTAAPGAWELAGAADDALPPPPPPLLLPPEQPALAATTRVTSILERDIRCASLSRS
jgi:hypothetical protein